MEELRMLGDNLDTTKGEAFEIDEGNVMENYQHQTRSIKYKVFAGCIYFVAELLILTILCLSVVVSIIFAILSGDYSTASFIAWFIFTFSIVSLLIYLSLLICKRHRSSNNFKQFTKIRCGLFGIEFLLIFFVYQITASMLMPNSTIFPNLYSTEISQSSPGYHETMNVAKSFFDCHVNFDTVYLRDISQSPLTGHSAAAYVIGDTIHYAWPTYSPYLFVHESTHIWQFRNGYFDGIDGLNTIIDWFPPPDSYYDYGDLAQHRLNGKKFIDFNIEQQAEIIAYYFLMYAENSTHTEDLEYYATQTILTQC